MMSLGIITLAKIKQAMGEPNATNLEAFSAFFSETSLKAINKSQEQAFQLLAEEDRIALAACLPDMPDELTPTGLYYTIAKSNSAAVQIESLKHLRGYDNDTNANIAMAFAKDGTLEAQKIIMETVYDKKNSLGRKYLPANYAYCASLDLNLALQIAQTGSEAAQIFLLDKGLSKLFPEGRAAKVFEQFIETGSEGALIKLMNYRWKDYYDIASVYDEEGRLGYYCGELINKLALTHWNKSDEIQLLVAEKVGESLGFECHYDLQTTKTLFFAIAERGTEAAQAKLWATFGAEQPTLQHRYSADRAEPNRWQTVRFFIAEAATVTLATSSEPGCLALAKNIFLLSDTDQKSVSAALAQKGDQFLDAMVYGYKFFAQYLNRYSDLDSTKMRKAYGYYGLSFPDGRPAWLNNLLDARTCRDNANKLAAGLKGLPELAV